MTKASGPTFSKAKTSAMKTIANVQWDAPVPDAVRFFNEDGMFTIRLSQCDNHIQRAVPWVQIELARIDVVAETVKLMLEALARAEVPD